MHEAIIYKILTRAEYDAARAAGLFQGSEADRRDGFIHFSTSDQLGETAAKHFRGISGLTLLAAPAAHLPRDHLKWEPSRGGALFPHLYGPLDLKAVSAVYDLETGADGVPVLPAEIIT